MASQSPSSLDVATSRGNRGPRPSSESADDVKSLTPCNEVLPLPRGNLTSLCLKWIARRESICGISAGFEPYSADLSEERSTPSRLWILGQMTRVLAML